MSTRPSRVRDSFGVAGDAQRALIARRGALREQPETAKLRNGSRSAAARRNGTGPAPEGFAEKFNVRMLNFTSIMLPFDPRSADSGERSEGSDGATAPHEVEDMVCGQFRRAILERRAARALLREQPPSLCPTTVAHLARETRLRLGAPARDSVAAAAPFARALPVASVVRAVTDPRVAYTTSESTGLHRLHRLCNPVDSSPWRARSWDKTREASPSSPAHKRRFPRRFPRATKTRIRARWGDARTRTSRPPSRLSRGSTLRRDWPRPYRNRVDRAKRAIGRDRRT